MVVCPCGVMVPGTGAGRARRGPRPPSCFDTSSSTVTTQPKDTQQQQQQEQEQEPPPTSLDALTAASNEHTDISLQLSRVTKNKGAPGKPSDDNKGDHASRTTLALATTESGRYVGTRPLKSNRSPTPTLHKIPLRTSAEQKNSKNSGRPSKHLPAVRTSPTSPQDKQAVVNKATRDCHRVRPPAALPRHSVLSHRINDMNSSNQRRLLKQDLSPEEKQLRSTTTAIPLPTTKTFPSHRPYPMTRHTYANLPLSRQTPDEAIYENLRPQGTSDASAGPPGGGESQLDPVTPEPEPHHTTVWLSDSWKYNTIKRAPDFDIFEFSTADAKDDRGGGASEQQPHEAKDKRRLRSRLPTFGRKRDKENRGGKESHEQANRTPEGRETPAGTHRARISRRQPLSQSDGNGEGGRRKDPSPYSSDSDSQGWRGRLSGSESTLSSDSSPRVSPLISPTLSSRGLRQRRRDDGGGSPPVLRRPLSKPREGGALRMPGGLLGRGSSRRRSPGSPEEPSPGSPAGGGRRRGSPQGSPAPERPTRDRRPQETRARQTQPERPAGEVKRRDPSQPPSLSASSRVPRPASSPAPRRIPPGQGTPSQSPDGAHKQGTERRAPQQVPTVGPRQEVSSRVPTADPRLATCSRVPVRGPGRGAPPQGLGADPKEEALPKAGPQREVRSEVADAAESEQETCRRQPAVYPEQGTRSQPPTDDAREGREAGASGCFGGTRSSDTSPTLPPLPQELDPTRTNSSQEAGGSEVASLTSSVDFTSVCILSLDLTVDCEELGENGFSVVNIKEIEQCNSTENETEKDKSKDNVSFCSSENENIGGTETPAKNPSLGSRSLSASSSSVRFDEKYYEKDDYDFPEESDGDESEGGEDSPDEGIPSMLNCRSDDTPHKMKNDTMVLADDDDFIEIDCDVKPMEKLKRPLVYGYGKSPIRMFRRSSPLEKRLSQASDVSDYLEMRVLQSLLNGDYDAGVQHSESCIDLKETYWDHWQAKRSAEERLMSENRNTEDPQRNRLPKFPKCPSSRFCYDPEVLLSHVKCPKSLEDATFRQYSACVKSHIYDRFGNVHEGLKEYGLTQGQPDWISSQPELPDLPNEYRGTDASAMDYSSEPDLSDTAKRWQPWAVPGQCHPRRVPPSALGSREASLDSGNWTYFPSSEESTVAPSPLTYHPEPLPRSASSRSHVRSGGSYSPWHHLLPDVTPPRTPRHSAYYNSGGSGVSSPSGSRPSSPLPPEPHALPRKKRQALPVEPSPPPAPKRSFLPSLSAVVRSPLKRQNAKGTRGSTGKVAGHGPGDAPAPHESIKNRRLTSLSSKSSSSSSSSSSGSSKDSVKTVIAATPRSKGAMWLMRHFGKGNATAV